MECNHPDALRRTGTDGKCHCGICWAVLDEKKEQPQEPKKRATRKKAD